MKDKWPYHSKRVKFRGERYSKWDKFGITHHYPLADVDFFGAPLTFFKAQLVLKKYNQQVKDKIAKKPWLGGCDSLKDSLDFAVLVPSLSEKRQSHYTITGKFKLPKEEITGIPYGDIYFLDATSHACEDVGFQGNIQQMPGPCIHNIAFQYIIEKNSAKWCNKKGGNYTGKSVWKKYKENPDNFYVFEKVPKDVMDLYKQLVKSKTKSLVLEEIMLIYLKEKHKQTWTPEKKKEFYRANP